MQKQIQIRMGENRAVWKGESAASNVAEMKKQIKSELQDKPDIKAKVDTLQFEQQKERADKIYWSKAERLKFTKELQKQLREDADASKILALIYNELQNELFETRMDTAAKDYAGIDLNEWSKDKNTTRNIIEDAYAEHAKDLEPAQREMLESMIEEELKKKSENIDRDWTGVQLGNKITKEEAEDIAQYIKTKAEFIKHNLDATKTDTQRSWNAIEVEKPDIDAAVALIKDEPEVQGVFTSLQSELSPQGITINKDDFEAVAGEAAAKYIAERGLSAEKLLILQKSPSAKNSVAAGLAREGELFKLAKANLRAANLKNSVQATLVRDFAAPIQKTIAEMKALSSIPGAQLSLPDVLRGIASVQGKTEDTYINSNNELQLQQLVPLLEQGSEVIIPLVIEDQISIEVGKIDFLQGINVDTTTRKAFAARLAGTENFMQEIDLIKGELERLKKELTTSGSALLNSPDNTQAALGAFGLLTGAQELDVTVFSKDKITDKVNEIIQRLDAINQAKGALLAKADQLTQAVQKLNISNLGISSNVEAELIKKIDATNIADIINNPSVKLEELAMIVVEEELGKSFNVARISLGITSLDDLTAKINAIPKAKSDLLAKADQLTQAVQKLNISNLSISSNVEATLIAKIDATNIVAIINNPDVELEKLAIAVVEEELGASFNVATISLGITSLDDLTAKINAIPPVKDKLLAKADQLTQAVQKLNISTLGISSNVESKLIAKIDATNIADIINNPDVELEKLAMIVVEEELEASFGEKINLGVSDIDSLTTKVGEIAQQKTEMLRQANEMIDNLEHEINTIIPSLKISNLEGKSLDSQITAKDVEAIFTSPQNLEAIVIASVAAKLKLKDAVKTLAELENILTTGIQDLIDLKDDPRLGKHIENLSTYLKKIDSKFIQRGEIQLSAVFAYKGDLPQEIMEQINKSEWEAVPDGKDAKSMKEKAEEFATSLGLKISDEAKFLKELSSLTPKETIALGKEIEKLMTSLQGDSAAFLKDPDVKKAALAHLNSEFVKGDSLNLAPLANPDTVQAIQEKIDAVTAVSKELEDKANGITDQLKDLPFIAGIFPGKVNMVDKVMAKIDASNVAAIIDNPSIELNKLAMTAVTESIRTELELKPDKKLVLPDTLEEFGEKITVIVNKWNDVIKPKLDEVTKKMNEEIEKFGGKLPPSLGNFEGAGILTASVITVLDNPDSLEDEVVKNINNTISKSSVLKLIYQGKKIQKLEELSKANLETLSKRFDALLINFLTEEHTINGVKLNLKEDYKTKDGKVSEVLKEKAAEVRSKMIPLMSEFFLMKGYSDKPLINEKGEIDLDALDQAMKNDKTKEFIKILEESDYDMNRVKNELSVADDKLDEKDPRRLAKDFIRDAGDFVFEGNSEATANVQTTLRTVLTQGTVTELAMVDMKKAWKEAQEAFAKGTFEGMLEGVFLMLGAIMKPLSYVSNWFTEQWDKAKKPMAAAASQFAKTAGKFPGGGELAKSAQEFVEKVQLEKLEKNFKFTPEEIGKLKEMPHTIGDLIKSLNSAEKGKGITDIAKKSDITSSKLEYLVDHIARNEKKLYDKKNDSGKKIIDLILEKPDLLT